MKKKISLLCILAIVVLLVPASPGSASGGPILVENNTVWLDTNGDPIMAQGGCIIEVDGTYHWFGPYFTNRDDPIKFREIRHYTSTDLKNWTRQSGGELKPGMPTVPFQQGNWVGRPYVLRNELTSKYVMWVEWSDNEPGTRNKYVVFTADDLYAANAWTYQGVFKTLPDATGTHRILGDMGMYQEGSEAYLLYTFDKNERNDSYAFVKLSNDFLSPLPPVPGNYVEFTGGIWKEYDGDFREAHAVFKRDGIYYHFSSNTRGFRPSDTSYRTATNMMGPWSDRYVVPTDPYSAKSFVTQHDFVLTINGSAGTTYVYVGDRWPHMVNPENAKDNDDLYSGTTGYYAWFPITFDENGVPTIHGLNEWYLDVEAGTWEEVPPAFTLLNPGFEDGFAHWNTAGNVSLATASNEVRSGSYAAKSWSPNPYTTLLENESVTNAPAGTYTASVYSRSGGPAGQQPFESRKFQVYVNGQLAGETELTTTNIWKEYKVENIEVPAGATIKLVITATANAGAWAQYDDFSLVKH